MRSGIKTLLLVLALLVLSCPYAFSLPAFISDLTALSPLAEGKITLQWTSPDPADGNPAPASYLVKYATTQINSSDFYDTWVSTYTHSWSVFASSGTEETRTLTGLTPGATLYFAAVAVDFSSNYGVWYSSNDVADINSANFAVVFDSTPAAVSGVNAAAGNSLVSLSWSPNDEIDIQSYTIEQSSYSPTSGFAVIATILKAGTTHQDSGIVNGNTYYYRLRATDNTGNAGTYSAVQSTVPWVALAAPAISGALSTALSTTTIQWEWTQSSNASGYRVISSTSGDNLSGDLSSSTTSWLQSGLTPNTSAGIYVQVFNGLQAADSLPRTTFSLANVPSEITALPATTAVDLAWSADNNSSFTRYSIQRSSYVGFDWWVEVMNLAVSTTCQDINLLEGSTYYYKIWARNNDGRDTTKIQVSTVTLRIPPSPPNLILAETYSSDNSDGKARLIWKAPGNDGTVGQCSSYLVKWSTAAIDENNFDGIGVSSSVRATASYDNDEPALVITGLYPGATYWFALRARDEANNYSLISNTKTAVGYDKAPDAPAGVSALALSSSTVKLSWTLPGVSGYDDRDKYKVYRATFSFGGFQASVSTFAVTHPTTYFVDSGLTAKTTYYYKVSTLDKGDQGNGLFSYALESALSSPVQFVRTPDTTPPGQIVGISASTGTTEGKINLAWTSPGNDGYFGNITGGKFRIDYSTDPLKDFQYSSYKLEIPTTTSPGTMNAATVTGLSGGATYYFRVWAMDEDTNWSPNSLDAYTWAQVDITAPGAINTISATARWRRVDLSWTAPGDDLYGGTLNGTFEVRTSTTGPINDETAWGAVPPGYPYRIFISTTVSPGALATAAVTGLTNGTTYYFAVKSFDERLNQSTMSAASPQALPTNQAPGNFAPSSPANDSIIVTHSPTFTWGSSANGDAPYGDVISYSIFYSTDNNFIPAITTSAAGISSTSYAPPLSSFLPFEDKTVYWRLSATDLDGVTVFSGYYSMQVNKDNSPPVAFALTGPSTGTIVSTASPLLSWNATSDVDPGDAVSYQVDYSRYENFSSFSSAAGISGTSYTTPPLVENATYWWRVWAVDKALARTLCSTTYYFKVNATPELPVSFSLNTPVDNIILTTTTLAFSWQATTDPDPDESVTYEVSWSESTDFASSTTISGLTEAATTFFSTKENAMYYWHVTAVGSDNLRRQSTQTIRFYVDVKKELPGPFELLEPANGVIISTTVTPLFSWSKAEDPDKPDDVRYIFDISPNPDFSGLGTVAVDRGTDRYYVPLIGLTDQTTYYWRVRASGYQGNPVPVQVDPGFTYSLTSAFTISMVNNPPQPFVLSSPASGATLADKRPRFTWEVARDFDVNSSVSYSIVISSTADFSVIYESATGLSSPEYQIGNALLENRSYYWKVVATDNKGVTTDCASAFTFVLPVLYIPRAPVGLKGVLSDDKMKFTISWSKVTKNTDNSDIDDLEGYCLYRGLSLQMMSLYATVTSTVTVWSDEDTQGGNFYYRVRSYDTSGIFSELEDSPVLNSLSGDTLSLVSKDQALTVEVPPQVTRLLLADNNTYSKDLTLQCVRDQAMENDMVVTSYRIKLLTPDGEVLTGTSFAQPLTLKFNYGSGTPAAARLAALNAASSDTGSLNVFWHNGIEYLRLGGLSDNRERTISVKAIKPGEYQLRRVSRAIAFRVSSIDPPKLFTPGIPPYEKIVFYVDNPEGDKVIGKVLDLRGEFVADLRAVGDATSTSVILDWDGKTSENVLASKGVYLYQIEGSGKVVNGTIMIAR